MKLVKIEKDNCRPCSVVGNYLDSKQVAYEKVNISKYPSVIEKYNLTGVPVLLLVDDNGIEVSRVIGDKLDEIDELIEQL